MHTQQDTSLWVVVVVGFGIDDLKVCLCIFVRLFILLKSFYASECRLFIFVKDFVLSNQTSALSSHVVRSPLCGDWNRMGFCIDNLKVCLRIFVRLFILLKSFYASECRLFIFVKDFVLSNQTTALSSHVVRSPLCGDWNRVSFGIDDLKVCLRIFVRLSTEMTWNIKSYIMEKSPIMQPKSHLI